MSCLCHILVVREGPIADSYAARLQKAPLDSRTVPVSAYPDHVDSGLLWFLFRICSGQRAYPDHVDLTHLSPTA